MYESYFGLERAPFTLSPDPRFLYAAPRTREAFAGVLHGVMDRRGFVVLTGESGTGKSTLLRAVLGEIPAGRLASSLIFNPLVKADEFLELAMLDFGLTDIPQSKAQRLARLQEFLLQNHREGRINVLFVDEAHTLTPELLEEVRLLTNFESSNTKLLQIVLSGHTELDEILDRHELRQLKQRIAIRVGLRPLQSPNEVGLYMLHRWRKAGAKGDLAFLPGAISAIAHYSQGIPRTINSLCDNGLLLAFGAGRKAVDRSMVIDIARDLRLQAVPSVPALGAAPNGPAIGSRGVALPAALLPGGAGGNASGGAVAVPAPQVTLPFQRTVVNGGQIAYQVPGQAPMQPVLMGPASQAVVLPLRANELPLSPLPSSATFLPVDEDLFAPGDGSTPASTTASKTGATSNDVTPANQEDETGEDTTPVLSYGSSHGSGGDDGGGSGSSRIGQWAARFRKATTKS
jgi:general secretion pathway protein A